MKNVIEDLWYGNVEPHETILAGNKQYNSLLALMGKRRDALNESLTDKQKEALEEYDDVINQMNSLSELEAFSYGLRLGIRLMIETTGGIS